jgi:hypothetical protein
LIDGSALFLASSGRFSEPRRLNYFALVDLLESRVPSLHAATADGGDSLWTMWTSADPSNSGQTKFLEFAQQRLRWQVRSVLPSQAFIVEPDALFGIGSDGTKAGRLTRFDASIAFAMGRLAESHRLVVISDSYALRDPMVRVSEIWGVKNGRCVRAFFGQASDPRWRGRRTSEFDPEFIDFDEHQLELFGVDGREEVQRPAQQPGQPIF